MIRQNLRKLALVLFLLLTLLGAAAIGPRVPAAGQTVSPQPFHLLACGTGELPPCG